MPARLQSVMKSLAKRSLVKREKILEAAAQLFLKNGYDGVSIDEITRRVGGSKTNVYSYFGGKEGLFIAVVESVLGATLEPLRTIKVSELPLEQALNALGRTFLDLILDEQALALHRLIVAESVRFPRLGRVWFAAGPESAYGAVEAYFEEQQRAGRLKPGNPRRAAALFLDMMTFDVHHRTLLQVSPQPGRTELDRLIKEAVETFLHGYVRG
jgi:TetR/AcrR family transcriptional regulator, mexJK operon transcriptional repressor